MSLLPYSLSDAIASQGWVKAWRAAKKQLEATAPFIKMEAGDQTVDHEAIQRALLVEPVTVQHKEMGAITASFPAALALDVMNHEGEHAYLDALYQITQSIKEVFSYSFKDSMLYPFPVEADRGMALPGLGALWLVTWAHQPEEIFMSRRKRGGSHTKLDWPNEFFIPAARGQGEGIEKLKAQTRLMEEAIQAYPLLRSNLAFPGARHRPSSKDAGAASKERWEFTSRFENALSTALTPWRKEIGREETIKRQNLDRLIHRVIQSDCMSDKGHDKWDFWDFVYGVKEDMNPSTRLTRAVDGVVFYLSSTTRDQGKWLDKIVTYLHEGGQLNSADACHAERIRRLGERFPATLAAIRVHEAQQGFEQAAVEKPVRRPRPRS